MSGICKYCGFAGTNDEMVEHAGEMCQELDCEYCIHCISVNNDMDMFCNLRNQIVYKVCDKFKYFEHLEPEEK